MSNKLNEKSRGVEHSPPANTKGRDEMKCYPYIKRLGQKHYAKSGGSRTLCDMPMLGNNYARESLQLREEIEQELNRRDEKTNAIQSSV